MRGLLSRYFDTCRRLIELYGGTVEKFIGDAVMAVWGAPVATEDDAERAVRAALDLVAAVPALGGEVGASELRARAGVLMGEAVANVGVVGEGIVAGDVVNTAPRIQSAAEPGWVLVGGQLRSEGLEPPFVGRDSELRRIKELFHACAEERRAHLVSVTGIAGIGKSRLAWERLAESNPVMLLFEDLQWSDASLLDFVEYLLEWSRGHRIFVVTLARPDLLERRPTWGAGQRAFTSLHLEPLPEPAMHDLLAELVPGLPEDVAARILARAEGVPLYAIETLRMLLDRGLLVEKGSAYSVAGEFATLEVPETLHALIASRLDGLAPAERRVLQDASVLGESFTAAALGALAGMTEAELEPLLASLVRKEVLAVQADRRSPEHGQHGFVQDLVRRVAYETLSKRERRSRHLAVAEQADEREAPEVVAAHLLAAYQELPDADDAAMLQARAAAAHVRAAERASSLAASGEAQQYFEQAAALTDDTLQQAELTFRAGETALLAGKPEEARTLLELAHARFEERADTHSAARVSARLADSDFRQGDGDPEQAVRRLEAALTTLDEGAADADVARLGAARTPPPALGCRGTRRSARRAHALAGGAAGPPGDVRAGAVEQGTDPDSNGTHDRGLDRPGRRAPICPGTRPSRRRPARTQQHGLLPAGARPLERGRRALEARPWLARLDELDGRLQPSTGARA